MTGSPGNRQDNRQRGNAAQLLEKYKTLARDAQLAGDRVQTEYYLQYADHYFRVLEENRSRFEEQQAHRRPRRDEEDYDSDGEGDEDITAEADSDEEEGDGETRQRAPRERGRDRDRERDRGRDRYERRDRPARGSASRDDDSSDDDQVDERIPLAVLPPAIGSADADEQPVAEKPRRRTRKPRIDEGDEEVAPAA